MLPGGGGGAGACVPSVKSIGGCSVLGPPIRSSESHSTKESSTSAAAAVTW